MIKTIHETVVVKANGVIELRSGELLPAGTPAEVTVTYEADQGPPPPLTSLFGSCKGCFKDVREVDEFIRRECDPWES